MSAVTKKRKRDELDAADGDLSLEPSKLPASQLGPVLGEVQLRNLWGITKLLLSINPKSVSFPSLQPSKSTAFKCYVAEDEEGKEFVKQKTTIVGETDSVEFTGSNMNEAGETGSRYGQRSYHNTDQVYHVRQ